MSRELNTRNQHGWQRVARAYAGDGIGEDDPSMRELLRNRFCERLAGRRVLEVGCGPGTDAAWMAAHGLEVTATDYAPDFLAVVRERYPELDVRLMDMSEPDLAPQSFDGIYGFASFVHLPRSLADQTLVGLRSLLAPGGLLSLWLITSSKGIREYTIEDWIGDAQCSMLFTCYPQTEIEERCLAAGYEDIHCLPVPSIYYDGIERLRARGIHGYQVFATRPRDSMASVQGTAARPKG